ncbi:MAG: hypothetical protein ACXW3Z_05420 [Limisphaerales bacterium]
MRKLPALLSFVTIATLLLGCATTRVDWNSRVGQYSYDDAVSEMGVPDRQATLSDGSIVAEWLERRGGAYGTSYHSRYSRFHTYDVHEFPDRYLRLNFGPDRQLARAGNFAR